MIYFLLKIYYDIQILSVYQNIFLSDDTITNNIAFGINKKDIDIDRVVKSIKAANLDKFIDNNLDGLETLVGEGGARLSGGQKQRIGIARALYQNPSIIVFDEATSALDIETEKNVINDVLKILKDKTMIIISHRLSTLENCDKIYKIDTEGNVNLIDSI